MTATIQASCSHCGKKRAQRGLKAAPNGGAICRDWFLCQRICDERSAAYAVKEKEQS